MNSAHDNIDKIWKWLQRCDAQKEKRPWEENLGINQTCSFIFEFVEHRDSTTVARNMGAAFGVRSNESSVNYAKFVIRKILSSYVDCSQFLRCILGDIDMSLR